MLAYCAGLGLPFVLIALGAGRAVRALAGCAGTRAAIQIGGGVLLVTVGLLLVTGLWGGLLAQLQVSVAGFTPRAVGGAPDDHHRDRPPRRRTSAAPAPPRTLLALAAQHLARA